MEHATVYECTADTRVAADKMSHSWTQNESGKPHSRVGNFDYTLDSFVRARLSTLCLLNARLEGCGRKLKARLYDSETCLHLATLAAAKANDLAVLLQLGDELIALLDDVVVPGESC